MSKRGNCHDNAVAESFFQILKRERIRRKTYADREEVIPPFFGALKSRGHAACAKRCFGV